tara:strand:+ start:154 stop:525 length:372 start_codon:yes stop_codon:yes gene_type:complete
MSEYYTPKIEEFHVGFEYEEFCNDDWYKKQYKQDNFLNHDFECVFEKCYKTRVKYLDKKDIEDLGFKQVGYSFSRPLFVKNGLNLILDDIKREISFNNIKNVNFKIKNKSELKKIVEMLGIVV